MFMLKRLFSGKYREKLASIEQEGGSVIGMTSVREDNPYSNNIANSTEYYAMILCHSLSTNDELSYTKFNRKITLRHQDNRNDPLAHKLTNLFRSKTFLEAIDMIKFKTVKDLFDDALQLSIETKRELVSFDLI